MLQKIKKIALEGMLALAVVGSSLVPNYARSDKSVLPNGRVAVDRREDLQEPHFINGRVPYNGLEIICDNEIALYPHVGLPILPETNPYISIGDNTPCYQITMAISPGRKISLKIPGKNTRGGIETGIRDIIITAKNYSKVNIQDRSPQNLIPLITTEGFFEITSGKYLNVHYDDPRIGVVSDDCGDMHTVTPAFQLFPFDTQKNMLKPNQTIFVDNYGKAHETVLCVKEEPGRGQVRNYLMQTDIRDFEHYFPTKAFARLTPHEKMRFWDNTSVSKQLQLRSAPYDDLIRYSR